MEKLPANSGWTWIKEGFALFRAQPGALMLLFVGYALIMVLLRSVPAVGQVLTSVMAPVFAVAFMQACAQIERGERVLPALLLTGFREPLLKPLLMLGCVYFVLLMLAMGASSLVDGGVFWNVATGAGGKSEAVKIETVESMLAMLLAVGLYLGAALALCFSIPLVLWKQMPAGKAMFFSVVSVLRLIKPFAVFSLAWFGLVMFGTQILALLFGKSQLLGVVVIPFAIVLWVAVQCSFYASYRQVFGGPGAEVAAPDA